MARLCLTTFQKQKLKESWELLNATRARVENTINQTVRKAVIHSTCVSRMLRAWFSLATQA